MADLLPTEDIIGLDDLKDALNVTLHEDDLKLYAKREAARGFVESYVGPLDAFETANAVPACILEAMKMYVAALYDGDTGEPPEGFFALIGPYRKFVF